MIKYRAVAPAPREDSAHIAAARTKRAWLGSSRRPPPFPIEALEEEWFDSLRFCIESALEDHGESLSLIHI